MKKLLLLFFVLFSCSENSIDKAIEHPEFGEQNFATDASGLQYPGLDPFKIYCGPGWGAKFCRFLSKHDGTIWTDPENQYSDFPDVKFAKFSSGLHFISFFTHDSISSYCEGWKLGETTYEGIQWNIEIKRDEEDILWFDYAYYGSSEEIEYSITYKYEVIDGLLHFSSTDGKTFIFHPSEKKYTEDALGTDEIVRVEGCMFSY